MRTENLHNLLLFCKTNALQPHTLSPDLVESAIEELIALEAAQQGVQPTLLHAGCGGEIVQTKPYCKKCRVVEPQSG